MSAKALYTAIKTRAEADGTLSALGTLYVNEIAPKTVFPSYRLVTGENKVDQAFGQRYTENYGLQFSIFATSLLSALTYQDALHSSFDNVILTLSSGTNIAFRRERDWVTQSQSSVDASGNPVYQTTSRYTAMIDRSF